MADDRQDAPRELEMVIVGAGFAGLQMLHRALQGGRRVRLYEAGSAVGGTWYWNRYPGARVDLESLEYSMSFSEELQQEWEWSERYAAQPELIPRLLEGSGHGGHHDAKRLLGAGGGDGLGDPALVVGEKGGSRLDDGGGAAIVDLQGVLGGSGEVAAEKTYCRSEVPEIGSS